MTFVEKFKQAIISVQSQRGEHNKHQMIQFNV